jgi:1-acyl-sn-glycerol-3-phosphate acyltransferase
MMSEPKSQEWAMKVHGTRRGSAFYFVVRLLIRQILARWLRLRTSGTEHLAISGPVILAPVHRSNLDGPLVAGVARRRVRALGKESLFSSTLGAWINSSLGAIPVRRGGADREAMRAAREVISTGEMMIVFPEGTRQSGPAIAGIFDGTAYLANKTNAPIIPIGIAGTEAAMGSGARGIKRVRCAFVVGEPIEPPEGRMSRPALAEFSLAVTQALQAVFDEAHALADS